MEMKVMHDQHVHTCYSNDSKALIKDYIEEAIKKGCSYFVMTDHLDFNIRDEGIDWHADYVKQRDELNQLREEYAGKITILQGIEYGFKRGFEGKINEVLSLGFDVINMSGHDYRNIDFYWPCFYEKLGVNSVINMYLDLVYDAITSGMDFDVLSHIDYAYKCALSVEPDLKFNVHDVKIRCIMEELIRQGKTLEINTKVQEVVNNTEHARYLLKTYYELGGRDITISSDSHTIDRYLSSFDTYLQVAKEVGFDHLCYFVNREKKYFKI